jgi:hypothetical protein
MTADAAFVDILAGKTPALAEALDDVERFIRRYMVLTKEQSTLLALWTAQTHARDAFDYVAYVHIKSPMPECGKTRLLEVLEALVLKPWFTGRVTAAVLMRKVHVEHPVTLLDESDAAFNGEKEYAEALRGMLNTGFQRSGKASACVGQGANLTYQDFSTFGPKAIAGIGKLPSTVESRSIPIALKRRTKDETVTKWRRRDAWQHASDVRASLAAAMHPLVETLRAARPTLPDGLSDRAEDVLEPLFAIADAAGGRWPQDARRAAVVLMGYGARLAQEAEQAIGLELLEDIRMIFEQEGNPEALLTNGNPSAIPPMTGLLPALIALDDRPWATFQKGGKPLTSHTLRRLLKGFDVSPAGNLRFGDVVLKGYRLAAFIDAFARYLPSKALQRNNVNESGPEPEQHTPLHDRAVAEAKTAVSPDKHWECSAVALHTTDPEEEDDAVYSGA